VDWQWARDGELSLSMGWRPDPAPFQNERGFITSRWIGYNEAMLLYVLAVGSPTHPIEPALWNAWTSGYRWGSFHGQSFVQFGPLFGHQYSHVWVDFRGIQGAHRERRPTRHHRDPRRPPPDVPYVLGPRGGGH